MIRSPRGDQSGKLSYAVVKVATAQVTQRAAFVHSLTAGKTVLEYEPDSTAAAEITALCRLACNQAGMITSKKASRAKEKQTA